jgi:hypothetical protein
VSDTVIQSAPSHNLIILRRTRAHDETRRRNAKTITPQDVIQGIRETEFGGNSDSAEQLVEVLMEELEGRSSGSVSEVTLTGTL